MDDEADREVPEGVAVFPLIPADLGVDPVLLAVIHSAVFLTGSEPDMVDPDAADETMHYLIAYLRRLEGARLARVQEDMLALVGYAKQQQWSKQDVRFLSEFLKELGIGSGAGEMK